MKRSENKFYKSTGSLPVFNFYQILNTKDLSWLVKGHEVDDDPIEFTEEEQLEVSKLWFEITSEYNELFGEKVNSNNYLIVAQVSEMAHELEVVSTMLSLYAIRPSEKLKMALKEWKYDADDFEKCEKKLNQLQFRMNFTTEKNKDLFKAEEDSEEDKKKYNLYKEVVMLESSLGVTIDVHKTVLEKWAALIMKNDDMVKAQRQNAKNR